MPLLKIDLVLPLLVCGLDFICKYVYVIRCDNSVLC